MLEILVLSLVLISLDDNISLFSQSENGWIG